jgi:arginyl-tRNA--protein-N-Asp/Glu arginylyltransferase
MINDEDRMYKKAVYDRERALNKYLQEDIKEKNRFCFLMQQQTMKIPMKKNRSHVTQRRINNIINQNKVNEIKNDLKLPILPNDANNTKESKIVNEGSDNEEQNPIQNKLQNEKLLSQKQPVAA